MCFMFVCQIVCIDDIWMSGFHNSSQIFDRQFVGSVLDHFTGIIQHDLSSILSDDCRLALLLEADQTHLLIIVTLINASARRTASIGDNNASKPEIILLEAIQNWGSSHNLNIILVGTN